jgi:hypothetical protein
MKIVLTPPVIVSKHELDPIYVKGIKNLWSSGRDQRTFVSMSVEEFKRGYLMKAYQTAKTNPDVDGIDLLECLGDNFDIDTLSTSQMDERCFGLVDKDKNEWCAPSMMQTVTMMSSLLSNVPSDNPRGTYENHDYVGFKMIERGLLPPLPVVEFSDGGDWDYPLNKLHYPALQPDGSWEIAEYIPLTGNYMLRPSGVTVGYDNVDVDEDEETNNVDWIDVGDLDVKWQHTCDEFSLVFTTRD